MKQFGKLLGMEGVELEFTVDSLHELARQAVLKGTGARALRSLLEKLLLDVMYDIPAATDVECVKITKPVVLGEQKPIIQRKAEKAAA